MGRSKPLRPGAQARSAAIQKFASSPSSSTNGLSNTTSLPAPPPAEPHLDVAETLVEVERLSEECEPEKARELCRRLVKQPDGEKDPKVWEALAVVELDLEEVTKAKKVRPGCCVWFAFLWASLMAKFGRAALSQSHPTRRSDPITLSAPLPCPVRLDRARSSRTLLRRAGSPARTTGEAGVGEGWEECCVRGWRRAGGARVGEGREGEQEEL